MDLATIGGFLVCMGLVGYGIMTGSQGGSALGNFNNLIAILITVGGSFASLLIMNSVREFGKGLKVVKVVLRATKFNEVQIVKKLIELSEVARKEGLLALEDEVTSLEDEYLKRGIQLAIDGTKPELIRSLLETDLVYMEERHKKYIAFYDRLAEIAPVWGMIGTIIGLINMLKNLADVSTIGPNMAIALLTTLYGLLIANCIAIPIANKLKSLNHLEITVKKVIIEGILSIQAGEAPRVIEEKFKMILSPNQRDCLQVVSERRGD